MNAIYRMKFFFQHSDDLVHEFICKKCIILKKTLNCAKKIKKKLLYLFFKITKWLWVGISPARSQKVLGHKDWFNFDKKNKDWFNVQTGLLM